MTTVGELIKRLADFDLGMPVYFETVNDNSAEMKSIDDNLYSGHGRYRGVYIELDEGQK
jgi:hypothetical protein